jgi:ribosomal protein S18 acetylase RimI-like enzyme
VAETWGGWDEELQANFFDDHFKLERRQILIVNGEDAGCLEVERENSGIYLALIEVAPAFQSRGIGTMIINDLLDEARAANVPVRLEVLRVNPARTLYERLGFAVTREDETHFFLEWSP